MESNWSNLQVHVVRKHVKNIGLPADINPLHNACAIFPAPINPTFILLGLITDAFFNKYNLFTINSVMYSPTWSSGLFFPSLTCVPAAQKTIEIKHKIFHNDFNVAAKGNEIIVMDVSVCLSIRPITEHNLLKVTILLHNYT
jgi:hypothetical protein